MAPDLPSGTVTIPFTDVEGSTKLLHALGAAAYADALAAGACDASGFTAGQGISLDRRSRLFPYRFCSRRRDLPAACGPVLSRLHAGRTQLGPVSLAAT
jgi:hypothetical protein